MAQNTTLVGLLACAAISDEKKRPGKKAANSIGALLSQSNQVNLAATPDDDTEIPPGRLPLYLDERLEDFEVALSKDKNDTETLISIIADVSTAVVVTYSGKLFLTLLDVLADPNRFHERSRNLDVFPRTRNSTDLPDRMGSCVLRMVE